MCYFLDKLWKCLTWMVLQLFSADDLDLTYSFLIIVTSCQTYYISNQQIPLLASTWSRHKHQAQTLGTYIKHIHQAHTSSTYIKHIHQAHTSSTEASTYIKHICKKNRHQAQPSNTAIKHRHQGHTSTTAKKRIRKIFCLTDSDAWSINL